MLMSYRLCNEASRRFTGVSSVERMRLAAVISKNAIASNKHLAELPETDRTPSIKVGLWPREGICYEF